MPIDEATWDCVVGNLDLSPRMAEIARLLLCGLEGKEIASRLKIGLPTVRTYLGRLYRRVGVAERVGFILHVFALVVRLERTDGCHPPR